MDIHGEWQRTEVVLAAAVAKSGSCSHHGWENGKKGR